jgi:hypothetical protein
MSKAQRTRDHETIRSWVEARNGHPATVSSTKGDDDAGLLRIDFPDEEPDGDLEEISWDEFFEKFDEEDIEFLYQDESSGGKASRFCKFVRAGQ